MELLRSLDKQTSTMMLAPFQPMTRIELETRLNTNIECYLDLQNPANKILSVTVTKTPDVKRQITLSVMELQIPAKGSSTISIKWCPREAGCWRDILQLTDSRRIKYEIIISTTAKGDRKKMQKKWSKSSLPKSPIPKKNIQFHQNISSIPINDQFSINNTASQMRRNKSKHENNWDKENVHSENDEMRIYASRQENDKTMRIHEHYKLKNILSEHTNIWCDENILPQTLNSLKVPQDIRRVTYIKETRHCTSTLYEHDEEVTQDTACTADQAQSNFSMLIDKLSFTSSDVIASSSHSIKTESMEFMNSQNTDGTCGTRNKTFAVDSRTFEISKVSDLDTDVIDLPRAENCELSFKNDMSNLIASSPIVQFQYSSIPKDECVKRIADRSTQTTHEYFTCQTIPEDIETTKETGDIYIEISPPKKLFHSKPLSRINMRTGKITKGKNSHEGKSPKKFQLIPIAKNSPKNVPTIKINKLSLHALHQKKRHVSSFSQNSIFRMQNEENIYEVFELDPFAPSTTENPFYKNIVHHSEQWWQQQESAFTKWLNILLSAPKDLWTNTMANIDNAIAHTIEMWQSGVDYDKGINADVPVTKEVTSARLNALRKAARTMFRRDEVVEVKSHITSIVKEKLYIRSDRNLHRDLGLQKDVLSLFMCYNPLWLRIGLETIYDEHILLHHNNDVFGLNCFLLKRFFTDPGLTKMRGYHKTDPSKKFVKLMNHFMLTKFLFLVYFLDYAKQHKLIGHDPCLFHKKALYKTSRDILLRFSRDFLANVGDVTKVLRIHNYVVTHRQTYIDEYDYMVMDLRCDLRDGVRLCRVMEYITGVNGLTRQCRVPAISRLQKVHNVNLALAALYKAGHVLTDDVDVKSIADGHRERTLSLLWQIIHKYQAPRFHRAARVIQKWWRSQMWYIRVRNYLYARRNLATIAIQRAWRRKIRQACHVVTVERERFLCLKTAAIYLQRWWRQARRSPRIKELRELKHKRQTAIITLQRKWRTTLLMRKQRDRYLNLKNAALMIQVCWRARQAAKLQQSKYLEIRRDAAARIQSWWRSTRVMREKREWFLRCRRSACVIQKWWLRYLSVRIVAVLTIETWWVSVNIRMKYLQLRRNVILIQKTWRKHRERHERERERRNACLVVQTWWRAISCSRRYKLQKSCCVKLQRWWRYHLKRQQAASLIGSWYLRAKSGRAVRLRYLRMRNAAIRIQNWWRVKSAARKERKRYLQLRENVIVLQTHWRRRISIRRDRQGFLSKRRACVTLQSWWRMMRISRSYKSYRSYVLMVQRRWRAVRISRLARKEYQETRARIVILQACWRGFATRRRLLVYRQAAIVIQSYYRMRIAMRRYEEAKCAALTIQSCWRRYRRTRAKRELCQQQEEDLASIVAKIQKECGEVATQLDQKMLNEGYDYWQEKISVLRTCNSIGTLLTCLTSLDTVMKLSPTVCVILCRLNLVDEIYKTISHRNRSQPWMNVCQQACSILITLANYSYTRKYVAQQKSALLLVKLLNDTLKEKEVFLHCATLIWLLSQEEDYLEAMMMCSNISWLLRNIQQKVLKDTTVSKLKKLKNSSYEPDRNSTRVFTNMSVAIAAIVERISTKEKEDLIMLIRSALTNN